MGTFDPFGQLFESLRSLEPSPRGDTERFALEGGARLYRATIIAFWLIVAAIITARLAFAFHGSLFAFTG